MCTFCALERRPRRRKNKNDKKKVCRTQKKNAGKDFFYKKKHTGKDFFYKKHAGTDFFYSFPAAVLSTIYTGQNNTTNRQIRLLG